MRLPVGLDISAIELRETTGRDLIEVARRFLPYHSTYVVAMILRTITSVDGRAVIWPIDMWCAWSRETRTAVLELWLRINTVSQREEVEFVRSLNL